MLPEIVLLRVVWGPMQRFAWQALLAGGTSATDPFAGVISVPNNGVTISNLNLYLALETDDAIISDLLALQHKGYEMAIPAVSSNKQVSTGTSIAITVKVTPDMGFLLKQIVYAPFNAEDAKLTTSQDHNNRLGVKLMTYNTQLDSRPRQNYLLSCATNVFDDWKMHERFCKGTAIQNRDIYQYNWFHCEDFSDMTLKTMSAFDVPSDNIISGRPIVEANGSSERIWTVYGTGAAALTHYTFIVTWRTLIVSPTSVMVVNTPPRGASD